MQDRVARNCVCRALLGLIAACLVLAEPSVRAGESAWRPVTIDGRDYVSVDNIARFYQLRGSTVMFDHRITLSDGRTTVEFGSNPREIFINGVKQWLLFPVIVRDDAVLVSRFDLAKTIEPCLRPTMIANLRSFRTIVLDAGHGGADRGAGNRSGAEKDYTLDVCRDLKWTLEGMGIRVVLTRPDDQYIGLENRADLANGVNDAVFVSLHFNSSADGGNANGIEVYAMTPQGAASTGDIRPAMDQFEGTPGNEFDEASVAMASCVQSSILGHLNEADRGVRRARFAVLRLTHAPAILIEAGFLTNTADSKSINDPAWRQRLADAIAQGLQSFQGVAVLHQAPKLLADYRNEQLPLLGSIVNPAALAVRNNPAANGLMPVSNNGVSGAGTPPVRSGGGFPSPN